MPDLQAARRDCLHVHVAGPGGGVLQVLRGLPARWGTNSPARSVARGAAAAAYGVAREKERNVIPTVVHFVWWQGGLVPEPVATWVDTWRDTWAECTEVRMWRCDEIHTLARRHNVEHLLVRAHGRSQASNFARYLILLEHGGLYLDTDYQRIGDVARVIADARAGAVTCWATTGERASCAFVASAPGHELAHALVRDLGTRDPSEQYSLGIHYFTEHVKAARDVVVLPQSVASPPVKRKHGIPHAAVTPDTVAIHWWGSTWATDSHAPL
jgi:mannosyltransferase OCH1-like enzyme